MPQDAPLEICRSSSRAPFVLFVEGTLGVPYAKTVLVPGWFKLIAPNSFSVQCPRRFCELDPEMLHTCFTCPCRAVIVFFPAGNVCDALTHLKTQIFQKKTLTQMSAQKEKKPIR